ncbi:hypothetical protein LCGC14_1881140 [marine sediment metagenome]|uniref:Uncharacterized protein n=1 Tax=marine sediment metagenome TaxID=412755 RepID=A0A0F9IG98_9ZZZZ
MVIVKKGSSIKDKEGKDYELASDARVEPVEYLNARLIFKLGGVRYAAWYSDIRFEENQDMPPQKIRIE